MHLRRLLIAEVFINIARSCFFISIGFYFYRATGAIWAFASTIVFELIVAFLLQSIAGVLVDKYGPTKILKYASASCFVLSLILIAFSWFSASVWIMIFTVVMINSTKPFIRIATFSVVPIIFQDHRLKGVNSGMAIALQIGQIFGVILAGVSLSQYPEMFVFSLISCCFLMAFIAYFPLRLDRSIENIDLHINNHSFKSYIDILKKNPMFLKCAIMSAVDFALVALINLIIAPIIIHRFHGETLWLTYMELSYAAGAIVSGFLAIHFSIKEHNIYLMTLGGVFLSLGLFINLYMNNRTSLILMNLFVMGCCITWSSVIWLTRLQSMLSKKQVGRMGAIRLLINALAVFICSLVLSLTIDVSFVFGLIAGGLITVVLLIVLLYLNLSILKTSFYQ